MAYKCINLFNLALSFLTPNIKQPILYRLSASPLRDSCALLLRIG